MNGISTNQLDSTNQSPIQANLTPIEKESHKIIILKIIFLANSWIVGLWGLFEIFFGTDYLTYEWNTYDYVFLFLVGLTAFLVIQLTKKWILQTLLVGLILHIAFCCVAFFTTPFSFYGAPILLDQILVFHNDIIQINLVIFSSLIVIGKSFQLIIIDRVKEDNSQTKQGHLTLIWGGSFLISCAGFTLYLSILPAISIRAYFLMAFCASIALFLYVLFPTDFKTLWGEFYPKMPKVQKNVPLVFNRLGFLLGFLTNLVIGAINTFYYRTIVESYGLSEDANQILMILSIGISIGALILLFVWHLSKNKFLPVILPFLTIFIFMIILATSGASTSFFIIALLSGFILAFIFWDQLQKSSQYPAFSSAGIGLTAIFIAAGSLGNRSTLSFFQNGIIWIWLGVAGAVILQLLSALLIKRIKFK